MTTVNADHDLEIRVRAGCIAYLLELAARRRERLAREAKQESEEREHEAKK